MKKILSSLTVAALAIVSGLTVITTPAFAVKDFRPAALDGSLGEPHGSPINNSSVAPLSSGYVKVTGALFGTILQKGASQPGQ